MSRVLRTVWSGGYQVVYNTSRFGDQYVEGWMTGMRGRSIAVGFLFFIGIVCAGRLAPALADERGPLWGMAERVCASGETPAGTNSEDLPLHGVGAANQPIRVIQNVERTGAGQRIRGILMPG